MNTSDFASPLSKLGATAISTIGDTLHFQMNHIEWAITPSKGEYPFTLLKNGERKMGFSDEHAIVQFYGPKTPIPANTRLLRIYKPITKDD